ncbi:MAG: hypothetical protein KDJ37_06480 [Hyphomicrobiaceae bacterium]|nr:hypothetical protein [Hyphomicrobiaceae bacterium]
MRFRLRSRMVATGAIAIVALTIGGCDSSGPSRPLPQQALRGNGETPYPGVLDQELTDRQQDELRRRGDMQR